MQSRCSANGPRPDVHACPSLSIGSLVQRSNGLPASFEKRPVYTFQIDIEWGRTEPIRAIRLTSLRPASLSPGTFGTLISRLDFCSFFFCFVVAVAVIVVLVVVAVLLCWCVCECVRFLFSLIFKKEEKKTLKLTLPIPFLPLTIAALLHVWS